MTKKKTNEGLGELADAAEKDHEVQMARADCYKIAKYAIQLHDLLKKVTEEEGLEGWQQAKITKAADYISSVFHSLEYDEKVTNNDDASVMDIAMNTKEARESTDVYKSKLHSTLRERTEKIGCTGCDEVSTKAAWQKNSGTCPKCKKSSQGVAEAKVKK